MHSGETRRTKHNSPKSCPFPLLFLTTGTSAMHQSGNFHQRSQVGTETHTLHGSTEAQCVPGQGRPAPPSLNPQPRALGPCHADRGHSSEMLSDTAAVATAPQLLAVTSRPLDVLPEGSITVCSPVTSATGQTTEFKRGRNFLQFPSRASGEPRYWSGPAGRARD